MGTIGNDPYNAHALLWTGTAASAVDLNPIGYGASYGYATDGTQQVGLALGNITNGDDHAILWSGTAGSAVDLNPTNITGFDNTVAVGVGGGQQVGYGLVNGTDNTTHAFLWSGTGSSAVDLNPAGFGQSWAYATNGVEQVGYAIVSQNLGPPNAFLWSGTAASAVNLEALLPANAGFLHSTAYSIDTAGNVNGIGSTTPSGSVQYAVEWSPVPNSLIWNNTGSTTGDGKTWDVQSSQNWNNGGPTVFNPYDNVTFNDTNNGNYNVTINSLVTPTSVAFANNTGNYTLTGPGGIGGGATLNVTGNGTVTLSTSNSYTGPTIITGGKLIIGAAALPANNAVTIGNGTAPATIQLATNIGEVSLSSLTINSGATLDNTNNALAINYTLGSSPAATIRQYLTSGYANDTWAGPGIDSSMAAMNPGRYAIGYADGNVDKGTAAGPNQVLIEYTLAGDANLDGTVNFADLLVVAQNFNHALDTHGSPIDWADGDFNYDGVVNFADLLLVAQNFNQTLIAGQIEQLPGSFSAAWNLALAEVQSTQTNNVPEPASFGLLAIGGARLLARRRRRVSK